MTTVDLLVIVYGSCSRDPETDERYGAEQRRVEIKLNPVIPAEAMVSMEKRHMWIQGFLQTIGKDVKHSRNWRCEFCKKRARETFVMNASWMHLNPPKLNCYIHSVCDTDPGPCLDMLRRMELEMMRQTGLPPGGVPAGSIPRAPGCVFPMSASCAVCHNEAPDSRKNLKQCSRCGLTRYCSVDCQRKDWSRHKVCCKAVKDVKWVWN